MSRINNCPPLNPNCNNNVECNCVTGRAQMVNGNCICVDENNNPPRLPPMPSSVPPSGYRWVYNHAVQRWVTERIPVVAATPTPFTLASLTGGDGFVANAIAVAKANPLVTIGLAITAYVAFVKKS